MKNKIPVKTLSALVDTIREEINKDYELIKVIDALPTVKNPIFPFNPANYISLVDYFLENPTRFKQALRRAILEMVNIKWDFKTKEEGIKWMNNVTFEFKDSMKIKMGEWNSKYENMPVSVECVVLSVGKEQTYTKYAKAICKGCEKSTHELAINKITHKVEKPKKCDNQECSYFEKDLELDDTTLKTGPYKIIQIEEPMDEAKHSSPKVLTCEIKDADVANTFLSQKKRIVGVFTSIFDDSGVNDILIKAITVNDVKDATKYEASEDDVSTFKKWIEDPGFLQMKLARSIAPDIYNETLAKLLVAICVAGGNKIGRLRGVINGLMIGDPSVGKSKILDYLTELLEIAMSVNGATASGAGITVAYDDKIKGPRIGAIPKCNGGVCGIDELGKIRKEDQKYLLQVMEDGKLYYDKGGFDLNVVADTTIIGGENPKHDYYDTDLPIVDNINLPAPVISRFDLIINMLTEKNPVMIAEKLKHIDEFREIGSDKFIKKHDLIPPELLKKYFTHVRTLTPKMSAKASKLRHDFYMDILALQQARGSLPIDTRFYEGLYRIATAFAKLLLSDTVTEEHMQMAIKIQKEALETFGMNVSKGETQFNLQQLSTNKEGAFKHAVQSCQSKEQEEFITDEEIIKEMLKLYSNFWKTEDEAWRWFEKMEEQKIALKRKGKYHLGGS